MKVQFLLGGKSDEGILGLQLMQMWDEMRDEIRYIISSLINLSILLFILHITSGIPHDGIDPYSINVSISEIASLDVDIKPNGRAVKISRPPTPPINLAGTVSSTSKSLNFRDHVTPKSIVAA